MKKYIFGLLLFTWNSFSQDKSEYKRLLTITVDPSRLAEDSDEFDSGLDIVGTLIIDRNALIEPLLKVEYFPNINFIKLAIGGNYVIPINKWSGDELLELATGFEIGLIIREKPNLDSWDQEISPGLNFEIRVFLFKKFPIILSSNAQYRTDFSIYNMPAEVVYSVYGGVGFTF